MIQLVCQCSNLIARPVMIKTTEEKIHISEKELKKELNNDMLLLIEK